jgi:hypothetical protein
MRMVARAKFPPVSAQLRSPNRRKLAAVDVPRRLISLMNPACGLLQAVSALCALSAGHFLLDQIFISPYRRRE